MPRKRQLAARVQHTLCAGVGRLAGGLRGHEAFQDLTAHTARAPAAQGELQLGLLIVETGNALEGIQPSFLSQGIDHGPCCGLGAPGAMRMGPVKV